MKKGKGWNTCPVCEQKSISTKERFFSSQILHCEECGARLYQSKEALIVAILAQLMLFIFASASLFGESDESLLALFEEKTISVKLFFFAVFYLMYVLIFFDDSSIRACDERKYFRSMFYISPFGLLSVGVGLILFWELSKLN